MVANKWLQRLSETLSDLAFNFYGNFHWLLSTAREMHMQYIWKTH